ncbi:MAG: ABC transporter ATP-binding protein [Desulfobacteraceae bacterium]|nr:ABC transporter ATP-binding protein [Desulfobacteraceae bacterium]
MDIKTGQIVLLSFLVCIYAVGEFGGISMLMPILEYVERGADVYNQGKLSVVWKALLRISQTLHIPLNLATLLTMAFIPILVRQIFYFFQTAYSFRLRNKAVASVRKEQIRLFLHADMDFIFNEGQGSLVSCLTEQSRVAGGTVIGLLKLISSTTLVLIYIFLLVTISPILTAISSVGFFITFVIVKPLLARSRKYSDGIALHNKNLYTFVSEKIHGIRLIKMLNKEKQESAKSSETIDSVANFSYKAESSGVTVAAISEPVALICVFFILYFATTILQMRLAGVGTFLFILIRTFPKVKDLNSARQGIAASGASMAYVKETIQKALAAREIRSGPLSFSGLKHSIEFDRVSFCYTGERGEELVLKSISFRIPKNSFTAIVGASGSGKSTLVDLIPRLRDITGGQIRIDGRDIREYNIKDLRSRIGFVSQEAFLFNDTIRNNLTYARDEHISESEIEKAARGAFAHRFIIGFREGYETVVGDRGVRLSGGERQRLAMARVLLKDPDILILDEPTSSLDSESEGYIQMTLENLRRRKTIILVAHRLSTIKQADQIIVIDRGRIMEIGDFHSLIRKEGMFHQVFDLQLNQVSAP